MSEQNLTTKGLLAKRRAQTSWVNGGQDGRNAEVRKLQCMVFLCHLTVTSNECPEIKTWYERKKARSKAVIARKALACKLAKVAFYVMRDGVGFDVKKMVG